MASGQSRLGHCERTAGLPARSAAGVPALFLAQITVGVWSEDGLGARRRRWEVAGDALGAALERAEQAVRGVIFGMVVVMGRR